MLLSMITFITAFVVSALFNLFSGQKMLIHNLKSTICRPRPPVPIQIKCITFLSLCSLHRQRVNLMFTDLRKFRGGCLESLGDS